MSMSDAIDCPKEQTRPRLAICSEERVAHEIHNFKGESNWDILPCPSLEEIVCLSRAGFLDAIALPLDPFAMNSRPNFIRLAESQISGRPFLLSYSTSQPSWIENLAFGVGSNLHIRGAPSIREIISAIEAHFSFVVGQFDSDSMKPNIVQVWPKPSTIKN